jgi:hypothetical protein
VYDKHNKPQADRPRWITPRRERSVTATADYLAALDIGDVLEVHVPFGDGDGTVSLSVVKVSPNKFGVHQRRGFPAHHLIGARVVRRQRRAPAAARSGSEVSA